MNRADKMRLLREIESGAKSVADFMAPKWIEMVEYDTRPDFVRYKGKFISKEEAGAICREANEEKKEHLYLDRGEDVS